MVSHLQERPQKEKSTAKRKMQVLSHVESCEKMHKIQVSKVSGVHAETRVDRVCLVAAINIVVGR